MCVCAQAYERALQFPLEVCGDFLALFMVICLSVLLSGQSRCVVLGLKGVCVFFFCSPRVQQDGPSEGQLGSVLTHPGTHSFSRCAACLDAFRRICSTNAHAWRCVCTRVCVLMHSDAFGCLCGLSRVKDCADGAPREVK